MFDFMSNVSNYVFGGLKEENMKNKNIAFSAAVIGFHVYKGIRKPEKCEAQSPWVHTTKEIFLFKEGLKFLAK